MKFRTLAALIVGLVGLAALPATASAATVAHTTTSLNVRSGPGTHYARVATLPAGQTVTLFHCEGSWCSISAGAIHGWASASYLDRAHVVRPIIVQPRIIVRPPHHHRPHWPNRPHKPNSPPHKPHKPQCKIAPGFPCK
jgi:uncharacterized protein YraI